MTSVIPVPRTCMRCDRSFTGKAGRIVGGKPACPSCGNALRAHVQCSACGKPTRRPGRSPEHAGLVCETCRLATTHATCSSCRRHRRIASRDDTGGPLCPACGSDSPVTHSCPDCGYGTPGSGAARCPACSLVHRIARSVANEAAGLRQGWLRDLFTEFCAWERLRRARGDMSRHIAAYARFFGVLDRNCADIGAVTQARLIELHGAEGLRRGFQAVAFLAHRLALAWDPDEVAAANERRRVAATMAAAGTAPWAADLEAYRDYLAESRAIAPATTRMYVSAAAALLRSSGAGSVAELTQRHVARHLRRSPGRRTNLQCFLSWVSARSGQGFEPGRARRTPPRKREKATLRRAAMLLGRLATARDPRERRAILAAAISVTHGLSLTHVLALRPPRSGGSGIEVAEPLASAVQNLAAGRIGLVFTGRNGIQPLSGSTVRYHAGRIAP